MARPPLLLVVAIAAAAASPPPLLFDALSAVRFLNAGEVRAADASSLPPVLNRVCRSNAAIVARMSSSGASPPEPARPPGAPPARKDTRQRCTLAPHREARRTTHVRHQAAQLLRPPRLAEQLSVPSADRVELRAEGGAEGLEQRAAAAVAQPRSA